MSLAIAAGLGLCGNEASPDLFQPYGGFPDGVRVENGHLTLPPLPGIGFERKSVPVPFQRHRPSFKKVFAPLFSKSGRFLP
jgi:hypothetical protein